MPSLQGQFLVASPHLPAPNFLRTVVLLVDYSAQGAIGLIVNRPTEVKLHQMVTDMESLEDRPETVWVGGPVAHWQVMLLVRSDTEVDGAEKVFADVHFTASRVVLEDLLGSETEFRSYAGYAGWSPGQLDGEVERGGWHILPGDADMVFDREPLELWQELISRGEAKWVDFRLRPPMNVSSVAALQ